jgi:hypothetical protein
VRPLIRHLPRNPFTFCEPCAGEGHLIEHMKRFDIQCVSAFDVEPWTKDMRIHDASWIVEKDLNGADMIITNPPWDREPLHQIIDRCARLRPTWLLFDADWMHTKQAAQYLDICHKIVSIGRVKWFGNVAGKDNCCWYLFDAKAGKSFVTKFVGRS